MITFFRFCLLTISITGYVIYFCLPRKAPLHQNNPGVYLCLPHKNHSAQNTLMVYPQKSPLKLAFVPALFCAYSSGILFAAGILNILPVAAALLFAGGFILLIRSLQQGIWLSKYDLIQYVTFLVVLIYFFCIMRGAHFTSYDNFSHWATVVKDMLLENRMPNFEDTIIRFQSYPLGSSLFIYYICTIIGTTEDCMLWAQLFMLVSCLFSITAFVRKKNWYLIFAAIMYSMWALTVNNTIYELRVDTLLPLVGVATFAMIYLYRTQPQKALFCSAILFVLLVNIKNSGIFFYAVCFLFLSVYIRSYIHSHKLQFFSTALLFPLAAMYLWKRHVAFAFPKGMEAKHSMSLVNYGQVFAKKTSKDVTEIALLILKRFISLDSTEVTMMLILTAFFILMILLLRHQSKKLLCMLGIDWGCLAVYTISMYAMYLFSMPLAEASHLASYDRYMLSVLIFIYGISMIFIIDCIHNVSKDMSISFEICSCLAAILLTIALVCQVRLHIPMLLHKPDYKNTERYLLTGQMKKDGIKPGDSCFIYCKGTDYEARYLYYLTRYELWSNGILVVRENDYPDKKKLISEYDHFLIWDKHAEI